MNQSVSLFDASRGARSLFYFVSPEEVRQHQDMISLAIPWFFVAMFLESLVGWWRGHRTFRLNDSIISLMLGSVSEQTKLWTRGCFFWCYIQVHQHLGVYAIPESDSWGLFLLAMFAVDLFYYWFHRLSHEFHFAFVPHSVHHSGEDYNVATALRQGSLQTVFSSLFCLPLALLIPPGPLFGHFALNTTCQFWFHTSHVGFLGFPLEYIVNT